MTKAMEPFGNRRKSNGNGMIHRNTEYEGISVITIILIIKPRGEKL